MKRIQAEQGMSLVEILVVLAVLSLVLAGIYGLLNSAYQTYLNTRRRMESQQTARAVMDYLVYRIQEIEGNGAPTAPWNCTNKRCHQPAKVAFQEATAHIPCPQDVWIPPKALYYRLETLTNLDPLVLPEIPPAYSNMEGNKIVFTADLLPLYGFTENFTDGNINHNGEWDWQPSGYGDVNPTNDAYDIGEYELLDDRNENSQRDAFGERWVLQLRNQPAGERNMTYQLVESFNMYSTLRPLETAFGKLKYNRSRYEDNGYNSPDGFEIVADGIISLSIKEVKRVQPSDYASYASQEVASRCRDAADPEDCHGSSADPASSPYTGTALNVYGDAEAFNMGQFVATHPWWNIRGLSVELQTASRKGNTTHVTTLKQFVIPRNLEVNRQ